MAKPKSTTKKPKLTAKQEMFCHEYLIDLNATQAAIRAGYSKKTANKSGPENLVKPVIQKRISELKGKRTERVDADADYVLHRLKEMAELDVIDILEDDGSMKQIRDWPKVWRTSISGLEVHEIIGEEIDKLVKKIKWPDKLKNLELLGKHVNIKAWDKEVISNTVNNIMPIPVADSVESWEEQAKAQQDKALNNA